jgi:hypothetical protein
VRGVDRLECQVAGDEAGARHHPLVLREQSLGVSRRGSIGGLKEVHREGDRLGLVLDGVAVPVSLGVPYP